MTSRQPAWKPGTRAVRGGTDDSSFSCTVHDDVGTRWETVLAKNIRIRLPRTALELAKHKLKVKGGGKTVPAPSIVPGARVRIRRVSVAEARRLQDLYGGWVAVMEQLMGMEGTVKKIDRQGGLKIIFDGDKLASHGVFCWNPSLVETIDGAFKVDNSASGENLRDQKPERESSEKCTLDTGGSCKDCAGCRAWADRREEVSLEQFSAV